LREIDKLLISEGNNNSYASYGAKDDLIEILRQPVGRDNED